MSIPTAIKNGFLIVCLLFSLSGVWSQPALQDNINNAQFIPDPNFRAAAEQFLGKQAGQPFTLQEAQNAVGDFTELKGVGLSDPTGIEFFRNIRSLDASNNRITSIDVSNNTRLTSINLSRNQLSTLEITGLSQLEILRVAENVLSSITGLSLLNVPFLEELDISRNAFSNLEVSSLVSLRGLNVSNNSFTQLSFSDINLGIKELNIANNNFSFIDLSKLVNLENLNAGGNRFRTLGGDGDDLDLSGNPNLVVLHLSGNADTSTSPPSPPRLNLSAVGSDFPNIVTKMNVLDVSDNALESLDITALRALTKLFAQDNDFDTSDTPPFALNTTFNPELRELNLSGNRLDGGTALGAFPLDFTTNTRLRILDLSDNRFGTADVDANTYLSGEWAKIDPLPGSESLIRLNLSGNQLQGDGAGGTVLDFSNNTALQQLHLSNNHQTKALGLQAQDLNLSGLIHLTELDLSFNPALLQTGSGFLDIHALALDQPGNGSLTVLNLSATGLGGNAAGTPVNTGGLLINNTGPAAVTAGLDFSDPTTITRLNLAHNQLDADDFLITPDGEFLQHSKLSGGKISPKGTGERFAALDLRGNALAANVVVEASLVRDIRNIFLIQTTARPSAVPTAFDESGTLTGGVAFLPVQSATAGFFSFQSGVDPQKQLLLLFPNGGERFDSKLITNSPTAAPGNGHTFADQWDREITLATTLPNTVPINLQVSTDGGSSFTDLAGSPFTGGVRDGNPESTGIFLSAGDLLDSDGNPIDSGQVVFRAVSSADPTRFDTSDYFSTFNKGGMIAARFTGLSLTFPNDLFVNPKGNPPTVEVAVNVSNPVGIDSYVLQFRFDPEIFFFKTGGVSTTGTATSGFPDPVVAFNNQTGTLTIAAAAINPVPNSPLVPNTLVKLTLNAFSFAESGQLTDIELVSAVARINDEPVQVSNASVFVINTFQYGDVNGDKKVGVLDANEILRYAAFAVNSFTGFPEIVRPDFPGAADVDGNGLVGAGDAAQVLRMVAGVITRFPVDENGDGIGPDPINPTAAKMRASDARLLASVEGSRLLLSLEDAAGVNSFQVVLKYDPSRIALHENRVYAMEGIDLWVAHQEASVGQLVVVGAAVHDLTADEAGLFSVEFIPQGDGPNIIAVDVSQSTLNDGAIALSAQSDTDIILNDSTGIPAWMVY